MKTIQDFKKLEIINQNKEYKKKVNQITKDKPLGAILMNYHQTIKQLIK